MSGRATASESSNKVSNETKVGLLVFATAILALAFAWLIGVQNPFKRTIEFYVDYTFAGGIEVGSPVRVSGIKVGRVESIDFFVEGKEKSEELVPVRLKISILERAARGVKKDSKFYINMAGIIGERYVEATPGTKASGALEPGMILAGVNPPRIDQLLSQSFDLAGKILEVIEDNEVDITKSIELIYKLSQNLNKLMDNVDESRLFKTDIGKLVTNLVKITTNLKLVTDQMDTPDGKKTLDLLYQLLWRLEPLDSDQIRKFLQKEGIRARIF